MCDFFEPPPRRRPEREERYRTPAWFGPPDGVLPGVVALELVLARSERAAVCITRVSAYPEGVLFDLVTMVGSGVPVDPLLFRHHDDGLPPERLRFGIQFPDGTKVTNIGDPAPFPNEQGPAGPVLQERGGGGGSGSWQQSQWLWPLPPEGTIELVVEWPAVDIALTRTPVDTAPILEAAQRAQVIFEYPEPPRLP